MGKGSVIARKCWEDLRVRSGRGGERSGWKGKRREYFEKKGIGWREVEKRIEEVEEGKIWYGGMGKGGKGKTKRSKMRSDQEVQIQQMVQRD